MPDERDRTLTEELVAEAVNLVLPAIMNMMEKGVVKRRHLGIMVLDPADVPHQPGKAQDTIYHLNIGDKKKWEHNFDTIAHHKAACASENKCNTSEIKNNRPYLLKACDPPYGGGVYVDGLAVGVAGLEEYYDEMIAYMIVASIRALCKREIEKVVNPAHVCYTYEAYKTEE